MSVGVPSTCSCCWMWLALLVPCLVTSLDDDDDDDDGLTVCPHLVVWFGMNQLLAFQEFRAAFLYFGSILNRNDGLR